jgi:hypothetical protein
MSPNFVITKEESLKNYQKFLNITSEVFSSERFSKLEVLYEKKAIEIITAPASTYIKFHNAFPGGFLEHTLRVHEFSLRLYETYKKLDMDLSGFTLEELHFSALHHDFAKIGYTDEAFYLANDKKWEVKNRGRLYKINSNPSWMDSQDAAIFLLQKYGITLSENEFIAIRVHEGLYQDSNRQYYMNNFDGGRFKTLLPYILHQADSMAVQFETMREENLKKGDTK